MAELSEKKVQEIAKAPAAAFDTPAAVLDDTRLSTPQKIRVLEAWEHLAQEDVRNASSDASRDAHERLGEVEKALSVLVTLASGGDAGVTLKDEDGRVFE